MKIVKPTKSGIKQAVRILKQGGVIVYPTDTAYALGGVFNSRKVISRISRIKERKDKKFTIITSSLDQVQKFFKLNSNQKKLAKKFWPGPLSIVVSSRFAVRVPKNKIARCLARRAGQPLIATSANITGRQTLYDSKKIIKQFKDKKKSPDLLLDSGEMANTGVSTVVKVTNHGFQVLRPGLVKSTVLSFLTQDEISRHCR